MPAALSGLSRAPHCCLSHHTSTRDIYGVSVRNCLAGFLLNPSFCGGISYSQSFASTYQDLCGFSLGNSRYE